MKKEETEMTGAKALGAKAYLRAKVHTHEHTLERAGVGRSSEGTKILYEK